jgi:ribonuclease-3
MTSTPPLEELAVTLGHKFSNMELLRTAMLHRSWQAEHNEPLSNERLEFLGDAVLGWVVADMAYHRLADEAEGKLSDLRQIVVNMHALADLARKNSIGKYLFLGKGEDAAGGRDKDSILADAMEAVIGAVYLDAGPQRAEDFVRRLVVRSFEEAIPNIDMFDHKTRLQELCARIGVGHPGYHTTGVGPDHDKVFTAEVMVDGKPVASGTGKTKKAAEQVAARLAYDEISNNE